MRWFMIPFLLWPLALFSQAGPKVFIDAERHSTRTVNYFSGSNASIISTPEIIKRLSVCCPTCRISIKKESADYVLVFAAGESFGSKPWQWMAYENAEGLMVAKGQTKLFNNSIKDSANAIMTHWSKEK
jgi:hypothetical protein